MTTQALTKGSNINLSKAAPSTQKFVIGLGWTPNPSNPPDLDASAFPCKRNAAGEPKLLKADQSAFVYFNNLRSADGAIVHSGDNLTGDGDGDDEQIVVDTSKIDKEIDEVVFAVTIHEAAKRNQTFGLVRNAYVRILDANALASNPNAEPLARYDLEEDHGGDTAIHFGSLYRKDGEWRFKAYGAGSKASLTDYVNTFLP